MYLYSRIRAEFLDSIVRTYMRELYYHDRVVVKNWAHLLELLNQLGLGNVSPRYKSWMMIDDPYHFANQCRDLTDPEVEANETVGLFNCWYRPWLGRQYRAEKSRAIKQLQEYVNNPTKFKI